MDELTSLAAKIIGSLVGLAIVYIAKKVGSYLDERKSAEEQAKLENFISDMVAAAEQTLKKDDDSGSARLDYVQQMLIEAGYELTEAVCAIIESKVYALNLSEKAIK